VRIREKDHTLPGDRTADTVSLRLVFGGGTALSRAHCLIRLMSEDIDLKIGRNEERDIR